MDVQTGSGLSQAAMRAMQHAQSLFVRKSDETCVPFSIEKVFNVVQRAATGLTNTLVLDIIVHEAVKNCYPDMTTQEVEKALILASVSFIERDPDYGVIATRLLLQSIYKEAFQVSISAATLKDAYKKAFIDGLYAGVQHAILDPRMLEFDLERLAQALAIERDYLLSYLGMQTLHERYFIKINKRRIELPQTFWMRVAMGLALQEGNKTERALEFYELFSNLRYISSTPTLFHSGYVCAQLSSCYLSTVKDDLSHIFKCIGDNAQLAKWAGGIGNDWTNIRGTGALIKSIHATSQGVIPFLKIANDVVVGITRSGIRRGGTCVYLEVWHYDIEDFLDLRRNTGDERRRTHDMNTANWIPDLFMKRVLADQEWTLFSPHEAPDLHELYGAAFEERYAFYEQQAREGKISLFKTVSAQKLWRKMLSRLFETGHPWITFKDPCNVRSPQDHVGVVHSSNLCTEITLNTSADETAVCNLGSINLSRYIEHGILNEELLRSSIFTAIRMLDNVIDLNFYPTKEARNSNMRHRPIGLGLMGFQDALYKLNINFSSQEAIQFADELGEKVLYYAIEASCVLAQERDTYLSYKGSKWDRGIFPLDTIALLEKERGRPIKVSRTARLDWSALKARVATYGMRNSNLLAVAPTATIANIAGCFPSIEPIYRNIYVKSNIAGEFTIVNTYLVDDLKELGLWDTQMLEEIKYYDGNLSMIGRVPQILKDKYKGAFELDSIHLIKIAAARGKWIDQSQSYNVFMQGVSGQLMHDIYVTAWEYGMKTMYYLRTLGASQIEKSTLDAKKYGFTQKRDYRSLEGQESAAGELVAVSASCRIDNPECESCQ